MNPIFKHVRAMDQNANGEYVISPNGGFTLALEGADTKNITAYAVAWCHIKDNYNKHVGRMKAGGRLKSPRFRTICATPMSLDEVVRAVLESRGIVVKHVGPRDKFEEFIDSEIQKIEQLLLPASSDQATVH